MSGEASTSGYKDPINGNELNQLQAEDQPEMVDNEGEQMSENLNQSGSEEEEQMSQSSKDFISPNEISEGDEVEDIKEDLEVSDLHVIQQLPVITDNRSCLCLKLEKSEDLELVLLDCTQTDFSINNFHCVLDNIIRCFNYVSEKTETPLSVLRLMLTDYFYRIRHELLFKALCKAFNLPIACTDVPFSQFGLESNRTPDLIYELEDGALVVLEITAVSNYDKAAQAKGIESAGFESKYEKEISELKTKLKKRVLYCPIVFDMTDDVKSLNPQLDPLKEIFNLNITGMALLRLVYSSLSIITLNTKEYNMLPAALLFSNLLDIKKNHQGLEFLYNKAKIPRQTPKYIEYRVSNPVYRRISNIWERIPKIMSYNEVQDNIKYKIILTVTDNKLTFDEHPVGLTPAEIERLIQTNNKPKFFEVLHLNTGNKIIKASESSTGYKYINRVLTNNNLVGFSKLNQLRQMNSHYTDRTPEFDTEIDKSKYREKLSIYNSQYYPSPYMDLDYEDLQLEAISKMDRRVLQNKDLAVVDYVPESNFSTLSSKDLTKEPMERIFSELHNSMVSENSFTDSLPLKRFKVKQPFILPLADINHYNYTDLTSKNLYLMETLATSMDYNNMFTAELLRRACKPEYSFHTPKQLQSQELLNLISDRRSLSMEITRIHRSFARLLPRKERQSFNPRGDLEYDRLRKDLSSLDKRIYKIKKAEGITEDISMIRLPSKNRKTEVGSWFNKEMMHFKNKTVQSTIEGVGLPNDVLQGYDNSLKVVEELMQRLPSHAGVNPDIVVTDTRMADDLPLLQGLKQEAFNQYMPLIDDIKNSYLGHACAMVSRLCHSLLFYSQLSFNSEKVRVDSLGYDNVLLIVRGGNKIFKSKSSKLFRLIYPINPVLKQWYIGQNSSFICEEVLGVCYLITPWQLMHESVLTEGISFYNRVVSFSVLNSKPGILFKEQFNRVAINVLLAFHNRRQTEVFLANLRYVLLSCLGDFSGVSEILKEFVGFNYDYFQLFLRCSFMYNFPTYFNTLRSIMDDKTVKSMSVRDMVFNNSKLNNIFTKDPIIGTDDMALMIYSTFLMTKAPYKRNVERAQNLKGILKIHQEYSSLVGLHITPEEQFNKLNINLQKNEKYEDYSSRLFSNDFNIDSKYIANLGVFADSLLSTKGGGDRINLEWIKIMNESWDSMATSTGLRGDLSEVEDFWGKKGYFVVYKDLIKLPNFNEEVEQMLNDPISDDEKRKKLRNLNQTYLQKVETQSEFWIFHAVDKTQWRGGREIYVMDIHTKQHQQPIEKFMGFLCKLLDNELISIPSDMRTQVIHHSIFEKDLDMQGCLTWYLTLDCSKWAPKSIFVKFAILLLNMASIPSSFKTHFLNYLDKLYKKRVYFNTAEVEVLKNNPMYSSLVQNHLIKDELVGGYYLLMPYSWVMGIFNYMSSFMHAINQDYASHLISKSSIDNLDEETSLVMYAHSDDSGGRITSTHRSLIQRGLFLYEVNLKACNHLLSKKKSVVSRFYFEILSIIYIFKNLLALLPKFLGGIRFLPTDKGPAQDMSQAYSKCIEVMVAGADFSIAHIVMCFYSALIWRFYQNRSPIRNDFRRPVQYFGLPAAHPLMVLLAGSDSDIVRLVSVGETRMLKSLLSLNQFLSTNLEDNSILPSPTFLIKVRGVQKGFENVLEKFKSQISDWSVKYVNFKATPFNLLNFLAKLNDPGFVGSLVNESTVRRLSRAYFLRSGNSVNTSIGVFDLKSTMAGIEVIQTLTDELSPISYEEIFPGITDKVISELDASKLSNEVHLKVLMSVLAGPLKICDYMSKIEYKPGNFKNSHKTLKPTHLQITKTATGFSSKFDPAVLVSYITQPEYRWALPDVRNLTSTQTELEIICDRIGVSMESISPNFLLQLCRHYSNKQTKSIYLYSRVPSDLRHIKTYAAFLTFLSVNSFADKELQGLTLKLDREIVGADYLEKEMDEQVYIAATVISIITTLMKTNMQGYYRDLTINEIKEIGWSGGNLVSMCDYILLQSLENQQAKLLTLQTEFLRQMIVYGNCGTTMLPDSYFYCFLKAQRQGSGWYGSGSLMIYCTGDIFIFNFKDRTILSLETNFSGKLDHLTKSFIIEVMRVNDIDFSYKGMTNPDKIDTPNIFGYDWSGDMSILGKREMKVGVPVIFITGFISFMSNLNSYNIIYQGKNKYILQPLEGLQLKSYKLYTINTTQSYIIPLIEKMFDKNEFEQTIMEKGFGDLGEFIYNEVLLDYGVESYLTLNEFLDGFAGSRIFEIFLDARSKKYGTFPQKLSTTIYPAPRGGLLRLFYEYTEENPGNKVVKILKNVTPEFMQVRSLFPEQFTAVLSEKLQENYTKLYSPSERSEITAIFKEISKVKEPLELQQSLIKTMCYWGYNSLCGMIALYNFSKNKENYRSIKWKGNLQENAYYSDLFVKLHKGLCKAMLTYEGIYRDITLPIEDLRITGPFINFIENLNMKNSLSLYGFKYSAQCRTYQHIQFINSLIGFLTDDDFCNLLEEEFKMEPLLSTLPMNHKNRDLLIPMYNNLKVFWTLSLKTTFQLNFITRHQRIPDGVIDPTSNYKLLSLEPKPAKFKYHHGQLNRDVIKYMNRDCIVKSQGIVFKVKNVQSELSEEKLLTHPKFKYLRDLNLAAFQEEPDWDDFCFELDSVDPDVEGMKDYLQSLKENFQFYRKSTTIKDTIRGVKTIYIKFNWVLVLGLECNATYIDYLRQIGENIILLTDAWLPVLSSYYVNVSCRRVNFSKFGWAEDTKDIDYLAYALYSDNDITEDLIDKLICPDRIQINKGVEETLMSNKYFNIKGEVGDLGSGFDQVLGLMMDKTTFDKQQKEINDKQLLELQDEQARRDFTKKKGKLNSILAEAVENNKISLETAKKLNNKYLAAATSKAKLPLEKILEDLMSEINLNELNNIAPDLLRGATSAEENLNMFQMPKHFGLAFEQNKIDRKMFSDKRVQIELSAIHPDLPNHVGAATLNISKKLAPIIFTNYNLWRNSVKLTKYKKQNKEFFLTLLNMTINDAMLTGSKNDGSHNKHDNFWRELIENSTMYFGDEGTDYDQDELNSFFGVGKSSRLIYNPVDYYPKSFYSNKDSSKYD